MPEITVISGKGGTGKTSITAAFAHLADSALICDLDVDAPDLHLLLAPETEREEEFISGHLAAIDPDSCTGCGECRDRCRFSAVTERDGIFRIDETACEGCKVCVHFCPARAIRWEDRRCGAWYVSRTRFGPMIHALLDPGQENSGRLVALLRRQAREMAAERGVNLVISDGSPGIGCPVISSLSGTDLAVIVTEPTPSGRHDLERVADLAAHFRVPVMVIVNKWDLSPDHTRGIAGFCQERGIEIAARIPFDPAFVEAMVAQRAITEWSPGPAGEAVREAWRRTMARIAPALAA